MFDEEDSKFIEEFLKEMNIIEGKENVRNEIIKLHKERSLDLDNEFISNNLLSMDDSSCLSLGYENYYIIFEKFNGKHFRIATPIRLLFHIKELLKDNYISNIAFKIESISDRAISMEGTEVGERLSFNLTEVPTVTRLYSERCYSDQFWITHDKRKSSIVFEEVSIKDIDNNSVITDLVHMIYFEENGQFYISHLDHEKIYYSIEEFEKKETTKNTRIKGKKEKTFKIDNSKIPINFMCNGEFFICRVLDSFISNKELLNEYFENITQQD